MSTVYTLVIRWPTGAPTEICRTCAPQMGDVAKDLAAGTVGGAAQLVVGDRKSVV